MLVVVLQDGRDPWLISFLIPTVMTGCSLLGSDTVVYCMSERLDIDMSLDKRQH